MSSRSALRPVLLAYLSRHPAEKSRLEALTTALDTDADATEADGLSISCTALVIDQNRCVLDVPAAAQDVPETPSTAWCPDDRSLLATAIRAVQEQAQIQPAALCLTPEHTNSPTDITVSIDAAGNLHADVCFAFYLAPSTRRTPRPAGEATWRPAEQFTARPAALTLKNLDGQAVPLNASVVIYNDQGEYLLHLRDMREGIWAPGCWALLGGNREPQDLTLEDTVRRELKEEAGLVPQHLEMFATEEAITPDGLAIPVQIYAARWNGDPARLPLTEGVMLAWFPPETVPRLRLGGGTLDLVRRHFRSRNAA
ncbi:NUDIX domain-containing protein [Streptomyces sp. NPDC005195]|uniref:NUDIX hydrolase n=1 Tax=Streptomyces sp. NPDC005195 TaxID=3154561 RepID=UPI00339F9696